MANPFPPQLTTWFMNVPICKSYACILPKVIHFSFISDLRKVYPYYFTFTTFTKGRWVGERILDVFAREFRAHPAEEYVSSQLYSFFQKVQILAQHICREITFTLKKYSCGLLLLSELKLLIGIFMNAKFVGFIIKFASPSTFNTSIQAKKLT